MLSSDIIARVEAREREAREAREARETQYILHTGVWKTRWIKSNSWTCCKSKDEDSTKCGETFEECIMARVEAAENKIKEDYYYGQMEGGEKHGYGTYTYPDGENYVGEFKNDNYHGQGTYTLANGTINHSGEWVNDEPIR